MADTMLFIYVPTLNSRWRERIRPGSAIVSDPTARRPADLDNIGPDRTVLVDYEGNLYDAKNLRTFTGRVQSAAGRHMVRYPTVARALVPRSELIQIGHCWWTEDKRVERIQINDYETLEAWNALTESKSVTGR